MCNLWHSYEFVEGGHYFVEAEVCFCVNLKSKIAATTERELNIGPYGKMRIQISHIVEIDLIETVHI